MDDLSITRAELWIYGNRPVQMHELKAIIRDKYEDTFARRHPVQFEDDLMHDSVAVITGTLCHHIYCKLT